MAEAITGQAFSGDMGELEALHEALAQKRRAKRWTATVVLGANEYDFLRAQAAAQCRTLEQQLKWGILVAMGQGDRGYWRAEMEEVLGVHLTGPDEVGEGEKGEIHWHR